MTDEQRKRIHTITYSTDSREELAERIVELEDEKAGIKRRLERAEQLLGKREYDIGKLRELVSQLQTDLESEFDNAEQMEAKEEVYKAENERLREYVAAIAPVAYNGQLSCTNGLYECEFFNQCYNNEPTKHDGRGCKWVIWARELGIEVGHD